MKTNGILEFCNNQGQARRIADMPTESGLVFSSDGELKVADAQSNQIVLGNGSGIDSIPAAQLGTHAHAKSDITDMPIKLPNPEPLTLSLQGNPTVYDGSNARAVNISAASIGAISTALNLLWDGSIYLNTGSSGEYINNIPGGYKAYVVCFYKNSGSAIIVPAGYTGDVYWGSQYASATHYPNTNKIWISKNSGYDFYAKRVYGFL